MFLFSSSGGECWGMCCVVGGCTVRGAGAVGGVLQGRALRGSLDWLQ
ncbi:hypothetical protein [Xylella fastidiosa]